VSGNMILAASSSSHGSSSTFLLIIVVLVVLFYFVMIRPQSKRRRQVQEQQRAAQPGQRVRTTAGMYATVVGVDGDDVILETAPGVHTRYLKRAIMEVLPDDSAEPAAGGTGYAEPAGDAEDAPAEDESAHDLGDAQPAADDEAPGDDDEATHPGDETTAHVGDGSQNGSSPAATDETRTTGTL
jgi:preprotein translocase subunit YajC